MEVFKMSLMAGRMLLVIVSSYLFTTCKTGGTDNEQANENTGSLNVEHLSEVTIGMSVKTLNAPYFVAQLRAVENRVKELGMNFVYIDAQDDLVKQVSNVEDLLVRGIDLLILNPLDPKGLVLATKTAAAANVPVIIIDSSIDPSADFVTTIQSNNLRNGELVGEWLVKNTDGREIQAALLSGAQGNPVGKERRQGIFRGIIEQQLRSFGDVNFEIV